LTLDPLLNERLPFITLFAAVTVMAWHGGRGPALLTLVLGSAATMVFVVEPRGSLAIERPEYIVGLVFYAVINFGSIVLFERLHAAQRQAEQSAAEARLNYQRLEQESRIRQEAQAEVVKESERLRVTLASIGDGVITTDAEGRVAFLNDVAQKLTGWAQEEAQGVPLEQVFVIINETTRQPVENPAMRSLLESLIQKSYRA
jgi:PAS domain-containing protein